MHQPFIYPSPSYNGSLVGLNVNIEGFDTQLEFLLGISNNALGFQGLKELSVSVRVQGLWDTGSDAVNTSAVLLANRPMAFKIKSLILDYHSQSPENPLWVAENKVEYDKKLAEIQELERLVFQQISVTPQSPGKTLQEIEHDMTSPEHHHYKKNVVHLRDFRIYRPFDDQLR